MFKNVAWATDGSEAADQALPIATELAAANGRELLVVDCEEFTLPGMGGEEEAVEQAATYRRGLEHEQAERLAPAPSQYCAP